MTQRVDSLPEAVVIGARPIGIEIAIATKRASAVPEEKLLAD